MCGRRRAGFRAVGKRIGGCGTTALGVIETRRHFENRALDHGADGKLYRLERALADARVEEVRAEEVEDANRNLAADDLLLV